MDISSLVPVSKLDDDLQGWISVVVNGDEHELSIRRSGRFEDGKRRVYYHSGPKEDRKEAKRIGRKYLEIKEKEMTQ